MYTMKGNELIANVTMGQGIKGNNIVRRRTKGDEKNTEAGGGGRGGGLLQ